MPSDKVLGYTESSFSSRAQVFVLAQACRTLAPLRGNKPNARYGAATCLKQPPVSSPSGVMAAYSHADIPAPLLPRLGGLLAEFEKDSKQSLVDVFDVSFSRVNG